MLSEMELCLLEPVSSPVSFQPHIGLNILNIHSKTYCRKSFGFYFLLDANNPYAGQAKRDKLSDVASLREYLREAAQKDYLTRIMYDRHLDFRCD